MVFTTKSLAMKSTLMGTCNRRTIRFEGELTSVKVSADSQYVVVDHAPDVRIFEHVIDASVLTPPRP